MMPDLQYIGHRNRSWIGTLLALLLLGFVGLAPTTLVSAIDIIPDDRQAVENAISLVADGMMDYYAGFKGGELGVFLPPVYWWEGGAAWGALINRYMLTNNDTYNKALSDGLYAQIGENNDFLPTQYRLSQGNDDQSFWAFASLTAAETNFPEREGMPSWLALSQVVYEEQMGRWDNSSCDGGLRWQIFQFNKGFNYKNSISNGALFQIAARLAYYTKKQSYVDTAKKIFDWTVKIGFITKDYVVFDGAHVDTGCTNIENGQWTYNVGVYLAGCAYLYKHTGDPQWNIHLRGFIKRAQDVFFKSGVVFEPACEPYNSCNVDKESFKGYLSRWLMDTVRLFPEEYGPELIPLLKRSAQVCAAACSGGTDQHTCGRIWYENEKGWDGHYSMSIQLAALETIQAALVEHAPMPLTDTTGGKSKADPEDGKRGRDIDYTHPVEYPAATTSDRGWAGFLTALFSGMLVTFTVYLVT